MAEKTTTTKRTVIFLGVGVFNTLLDFCFYTLLTSTLFSHESNIALAGFISGTFALLCAFLTHSFITWRDTNVTRKTIIKFFAFTGFGMWIIRPVLLGFFIKLDAFYQHVHTITKTLHLPFSYDFIANTGAFGLMLVIVLTYNYLVYERYVFSDRPANRTGIENRSGS